MKNIAKEERTHRVVHPSHPVHKRDKNTGAEKVGGRRQQQHTHQQDLHKQRRTDGRFEESHEIP